MLNVIRTMMLVAVISATAPLFASPARAASTYSDGVWGLEVYATSTEGRFVGTAGGDLPGAWQTVVRHAPLSGATPAPITGGSFDLATVLAGFPTVVSGSIAGGSVTQVGGFSGCVNQQYEVVGTLSSVGATVAAREGTGSFDITLTHHRKRVFGFCLTYAAKVTGDISVTF